MFVSYQNALQIPHLSLSLESFDGPLNKIFASFIRDFRAGEAIHPSPLFSEIARKLIFLIFWNKYC